MAAGVISVIADLPRDCGIVLMDKTIAARLEPPLQTNSRRAHRVVELDDDVGSRQAHLQHLGWL